MLAGYMLAGAPLAGGSAGRIFMQLLTESVASSDFRSTVKALLLLESLLDYDTYVVYNPTTHQQRDNITTNKRIRMRNVKPDYLRIKSSKTDETRFTQKNDLMRVDLKR